MKQILSSTLLASGLMAGSGVSAQDSTNHLPYLLVGTYTHSGKSKGIHVFRFNTQTGDATAVGFGKTTNPSYLAVSPDKKYVYAVNEDRGVSGRVSAFSFDVKTGHLAFINAQSSAGTAPCYAAVSRNGKFISIANYSTGNYLVYPVNNGSIGQAVENIQDEGKGPRSPRQDSPHAHCTVFSPDGRYLFAIDLGTDKIMSYRFDENTGKLKPAEKPYVQVAPGSGPRHLVFEASGRFAYLITELSGEVVVFGYEEGNFTELQTVSSHPENYTGAIGSADIHISPDGNFLYASNRGDANSIAIFRRNKESGRLTLAGFQPTLGKNPRNFNFDPSGNFLLVAHQDTDDIVVFRIDHQTGLLTDTGKRIHVGSPVCVQWIP